MRGISIAAGTFLALAVVVVIGVYVAGVAAMASLGAKNEALEDDDDRRDGLLGRTLWGFFILAWPITLPGLILWEIGASTRARRR